MRRSAKRTYVYHPLTPLSSLIRAIESSQPNLVIACDDQIVAQLHRLYRYAVARRGCQEWENIEQLITNSFGDPAAHALLTKRSLLLSTIATLPDIHFPPTAPVRSRGELLTWIAENGRRTVLKLDGTWGGKDVIAIHQCADITAAYRRIRLRRSLGWQLKRALFNGNLEPLVDRTLGKAPVVTVQSYIVGTPANCAVACWRGEVLGAIAVEVVRSESEFSPATVVRVLEHEPMIAVAKSIVAHLGISGFCGFDFILEAGSNRAVLIEVNPRATQINHLANACGRNLVTALTTVLGGKDDLPTFSAESAIGPREVALFPQEWQRDPQTSFSREMCHDIPFEEKEFLKFYMYGDCALAHSVRILQNDDLSSLEECNSAREVEAG
jgi:hypothetical protein